MIRKKYSSPRWKKFDYSSSNLYFVTSCIKNRIPHFGNIQGGKMVQNRAGKIAHVQWQWLEKQFPYVVLHAFVVMPDHIHGIIEIDANLIYPKNNDSVGSGRVHSVGSDRDLTLRNTKIKSLSELMGAYKTTTSKIIHQTGIHDFRWQRSFYDRIIRNSQEYDAIAEYILKNPTRCRTGSE